MNTSRLKQYSTIEAPAPTHSLTHSFTRPFTVFPYAESVDDVRPWLGCSGVLVAGPSVLPRTQYFITRRRSGQNEAINYTKRT